MDLCISFVSELVFQVSYRSAVIIILAMEVIMVMEVVDGSRSINNGYVQGLLGIGLCFIQQMCCKSISCVDGEVLGFPWPKVPCDQI